MARDDLSGEGSRREDLVGERSLRDSLLGVEVRSCSEVLDGERSRVGERDLMS